MNIANFISMYIYIYLYIYIYIYTNILAYIICGKNDSK